MRIEEELECLVCPGDACGSIVETEAIAPETRGRGSDRKGRDDSELPSGLRAIDNHVVIRPAEGDTRQLRIVSAAG